MTDNDRRYGYARLSKSRNLLTFQRIEKALGEANPT